MKIVALVPMRHDSERVVGKNFRPFAGKPLFHWILETLTGCPEISQVVVNTDSAPVRDGIAQAFPMVRVIERPERLRGGMTPMNDILMYDVEQVPADAYLQTHSTNPLLRRESVSRAIEAFTREYPRRDSLFSVTRLQTRLWDQLGRAVNHNPAVLLRTQDLPPIYDENSNLYIFTADTLRQNRTRIGQRPQMFEIDRRDAWDIDEEIDFKVAEFLFLEREKNRG
jgi:CMP-N-acetylneuraminic acid synthetase